LIFKLSLKPKLGRIFTPLVVCHEAIRAHVVGIKKHLTGLPYLKATNGGVVLAAGVVETS
jgi:hypothetical protein